MMVVNDFAELFAGNTSAVGTEEGGCARISEPYTWRDQIEGHLKGVAPCGVYPMVHLYNPDTGDEWHVKWGCVDFDIKKVGKRAWDYETEAEAAIAAANLQQVLSALGVTSWIERTRSCGRHVWVFADGWCAAATMRRALLVACSVAGVSSREVNPKQETLAADQLGNYVRLPYPGAAKTPHPVTRFVYGNGTAEGPIGAVMFTLDAMNQRTPVATLEAAAALYVPPAKPKVERLASPAVYDGDLVDRMMPITRDVFEQDMPEDRSAAYMNLANLCARQRSMPFEPSEVLEILYAADERWRKYADRSDRDKRLVEVVEKAYT